MTHAQPSTPAPKKKRGRPRSEDTLVWWLRMKTRTFEAYHTEYGQDVSAAMLAILERHMPKR